MNLIKYLLFQKLELLDIYPQRNGSRNGSLSKTLSRLSKYSKNTGGGSYGEYVLISPKVGMKIIYGCDSCIENINHLVKQASEEAKLLIEAGKRVDFVPKCYGIRIIKNHNGYKVGILMQHLGKVRLDEMDDVDAWDIKLKLKEKLKKAGIIHTDLHTGNIMFYEGKFWAIDFTPEHTKIEDIYD